MDMISFKWIVLIAEAIVAIAASVLMVTRKDPIHSALWMIVTKSRGVSRLTLCSGAGSPVVTCLMSL